MWLGFDIGGTKLAVVVGRRRGPDRGAAPAPDPRDRRSARRRRSDAARRARAARGGGRRARRRCAAWAWRRRVRSTSRAARSSRRRTSPGWGSVPIREWLGAAFDAPVHLENDANAAALAEWRFGAGRGARHLVYLTMSTGVGGGLVLDGRLYRGTGGAGEVGHMPVEWGDAAELCGCGRRGCLEAYVGGRRWSERLARITPADEPRRRARGRPRARAARARDRGGARGRRVRARRARALEPLPRARPHRALVSCSRPRCSCSGTIATAAGEALCSRAAARDARGAWCGRRSARRSEIRGVGARRGWAVLRGAVRGARGDDVGSVAGGLRRFGLIRPYECTLDFARSKRALDLERSAQRRADRLARALEQAQVEAQVVDRGEPRAERLARAQQVAQIAARVARAGGAVAVGVGRRRPRRACSAFLQTHQPAAREQHAVARVARRAARSRRDRRRARCRGPDRSGRPSPIR